jgi:hypothetical protein
MSDRLEAEREFVALLAIVYGRISWRKIKVRNAWDVWNHRLRAAAARGTLDEAISRLCNYFSIQSLPEEAVPLLDRLRPHERQLLDLAYREHVPLAMRAVAEAKQRRREDTDDGAIPGNA